jgi:branched-chain amino acid transport system ATP-binding protein
MLDEPSLGLAPRIARLVYDALTAISRTGTTILLVEQNANFALGVSKRGYVLETGTVALDDDSESLRDNPDVQRAYLGA